MDTLIENNIVFSDIENNAPVQTHSEQVPQLSVEEIVEKGSRALLRCFNMIRNTERLQYEKAFDEVCKLLLIMVLQDRGQIERSNYWNFEGEDNILTIFDKAKKYNSYSIFDKEDKLLDMPIKTYMEIMSALMHFNWANISASLIYEDFLANISRNTRDLVVTPRPIIDYMVDILAPQEGERICDPCCGNGGFLIQSYLHLNKPFPNNLYGVDMNEIAIRNTKMRLFMHNIEGAHISHNNGLFDTNEIIENKFDVIFAQPPFGLKYESNNGTFEKFYLNSYRNISLLYIERCLNLLRPGGRMGIIVGEGILFDKNEKARQFIGNQAKILNITSLPSGAFHPYTGVKASIIFLQKFTAKEKESELKDYKVLFADIKEIGVGFRSNRPTNNQLILLAKEYKNTLISPAIGNQILLKEVDYTEMTNWSVSYLTNIVIEKNKKYNHKKLSSLLVINTNYIRIEDSEEYQRVTVKLNNNGVILRDKVIGENIGTKRQCRIKRGQLIVSKIGAGDGALGIVPAELDNAIVTADFLTFTIKTDIVLPEYLELLLSSEEFTSYFDELSRGSVIKRIKTDLFLNIVIPVPPLKEQNELCQKIVQLKKNIKQFEQDLINEKNVFKNTLFGSQII